MVRHGFFNLNLHRIYMTMFPRERRLHSHVRECRLREEGTIREGAYKNGRYRENIRADGRAQVRGAGRRGRAVSGTRQASPIRRAVYVTRPLLPPLSSMMSRLEEVWATQQLTNIGAQHCARPALRQYLGVSRFVVHQRHGRAHYRHPRARADRRSVDHPFTFPATPHALSWSGITPVFCDIDAVTLNVRIPTPSNTRPPPQDLAVHVYGNPCDVESASARGERTGRESSTTPRTPSAFASTAGASAASATRRCSAFMRRSCFTPPKEARWRPANPALKAKIEASRFRQPRPDVVEPIGLNGEVAELQAGIVLEGVGEELARRRRLLARYRERFASIEGVTWVHGLNGADSSCQYV